MNAIEQVLRDVAVSGQVPDNEEIGRKVLGRGSKNDRTSAVAAVRIAGKRIAAVLEDGSDYADPSAVIEEIINDTAAAHDAVTPGRRAEDRARRDAKAIATRAGQPGEEYDARLVAARERIDHASELVELLRHAGPQNGRIDPRDLDRLALRDELSADERRAWRLRVGEAAGKVGRLYASGRLGDSREEARSMAESLAGSLARQPEHRDPHRDEEDPRRLARRHPWPERLTYERAAGLAPNTWGYQ